MDFKDLNSVDLKLELLSGSTIKTGNLAIKPYTLREIKDYGYSKYIQNIQWMTISLEDFVNSIIKDGKKEIAEEKFTSLKAFDFYSKLGGKDYLLKLIESISMIFRTEDVVMLDKGLLALNFYKMGILYNDKDGFIQTDKEFLSYYSNDELTVVNRENFDTIVEVIKMQNYMSQPKKDIAEENPADEETRLLMEEMKRNREKVEARKKAQQMSESKNDEIDIADIISAVSTKSNSINKINIWDLTLYELYDEYSRLELIDNYDFSIKAIMAGAEKIDLKHWSSKI